MKVSKLQELLANMDPNAEVVIVDGDNYTQELRVGTGSMQYSVTGRDKYVRGFGNGTVGLESGDDLCIRTEEKWADEVAICSDEGSDSMVFDGAILIIRYEEYEEEMTVVNAGRDLLDGTHVFVVLEGEGGDHYTCDILPSGLVRFETGAFAEAFPSE